MSTDTAPDLRFRFTLRDAKTQRRYVIKQRARWAIVIACTAASSSALTLLITR